VLVVELDQGADVELVGARELQVVGGLAGGVDPA